MTGSTPGFGWVIEAIVWEVLFLTLLVCYTLQCITDNQSPSTPAVKKQLHRIGLAQAVVGMVRAVDPQGFLGIYPVPVVEFVKNLLGALLYGGYAIWVYFNCVALAKQMSKPLPEYTKALFVAPVITFIMTVVSISLCVGLNRAVYRAVLDITLATADFVMTTVSVTACLSIRWNVMRFVESQKSSTAKISAASSLINSEALLRSMRILVYFASVDFVISVYEEYAIMFVIMARLAPAVRDVPYTITPAPPLPQTYTFSATENVLFVVYFITLWYCWTPLLLRRAAPTTVVQVTAKTANSSSGPALSPAMHRLASVVATNPVAKTAPSSVPTNEVTVVVSEAS